MGLVDVSVREFCIEVASSSPAPGGGSVAASAGAMGLALIAMACRLTLGREKYSAAEREVREILERASPAMDRLLILVDEDTRGFGKVMEAFSLPTRSDAEKVHRQRIVEEAVEYAALIPLETARLCLEGLRAVPPLLARGNQNAVSDMGVGALMLKSGLEGAIYNVVVNALQLQEGRKATLLSECSHLCREAELLFRSIQESMAPISIKN